MPPLASSPSAIWLPATKPALSIGSADGVDETYLDALVQLADRVQPLWVSDHLCWIGHGPQQLHDLYPLPYTDEAARHVITQIRRTQDLLQRRLFADRYRVFFDAGVRAAPVTRSEYLAAEHVSVLPLSVLVMLAARAGKLRAALEAEQLKNQFVSTVSHEFRTPLATIIGAASSLRDQGERLAPEPRRRLADSIVDVKKTQIFSQLTMIALFSLF